MATDYTVGAQQAADGAPREAGDGSFWYRGNLHTHTLWSDGDQYPEVVSDWYKRNGYHFLALSDHNVLSRGERWMGGERAARGLETYRERFGKDWVQTREGEEGVEVRLKPLAEFRTLFEEPGRFLMIESEEITNPRAVHVNATNIAEFIPPQTGDSVRQIIERAIAAVLEQEERTGQRMFPHLNHPNFSSGVTVEEMVEIEDLRFFEIYNGHRGVRNYGDPDANFQPLERMWDIMLALRLGELGMSPLLGLAVDDAHHYENSSSDVARPGRGWIMVKARFLTPEHIVEAIRRGDFYATSGVSLRSVERGDGRLAVEIEPEEGVEYVIEFIGTRRGFDASSEPVRDAEGNEIRATRRYSDEIGQVLKRVEGTSGAYEMSGDELYVRARITSTKAKEDGFAEDEVEMAWVQPVVNPDSK